MMDCCIVWIERVSTRNPKILGILFFKPFGGQFWLNSRIFEGKEETYLALKALTQMYFLASFFVQPSPCTWCRCKAKYNWGISLLCNYSLDYCKSSIKSLITCPSNNIEWEFRYLWRKNFLPICLLEIFF